MVLKYWKPILTQTRPILAYTIIIIICIVACQAHPALVKRGLVLARLFHFDSLLVRASPHVYGLKGTTINHLVGGGSAKRTKGLRDRV